MGVSQIGKIERNVQRYAVVFLIAVFSGKSGNFRCRRATLYIGFCSRAQIAFLFQRRNRIADMRNIFYRQFGLFGTSYQTFQYGSDGIGFFDGKISVATGTGH